MKRWDFVEMMNAGSKLFASIHRRKRFANPNHDVHLMARNISEWLTQGVQSIINGTYTPRLLKRHYFQDEMVDQLHLSDRILQNLLLKQLKPTFAHVMNSNCYHLYGPNGVRLATQRIKDALATQKPQYIIRADIRSYYKSIRHHLLLQDIKRYYSDPHVQLMLENIIKNPIETPQGYNNPDYGIALRGPLSPFFSALYLKSLDDSFDTMDVTYICYQDDIIILCQTKRQLERCKQRLMVILKERRLGLSRKKTRIGSIDKGFHFLGINYLETQPPGGTNGTQTLSESATQVNPEHLLAAMVGGRTARQLLNIQYLSKNVSFLMHERYAMHANKLSKWLPVESLSNESSATCFVGARGGCERQTVGQNTNYLSGFLKHVGISPREKSRVNSVEPYPNCQLTWGRASLG